MEIIRGGGRKEVRKKREIVRVPLMIGKHY